MEGIAAGLNSLYRQFVLRVVAKQAWIAAAAAEGRPIPEPQYRPAAAGSGA